MQRIIRLGTVMALAFFGMAGVTSGQQPMPVGLEEAQIPGGQPKLEITKQPVANNLQQVTIEFKWTDNTGIEKVEIRMLKKDNNGNFKTEVGKKTINTNEPTASSITKMFPDNVQPANTKVKIEITTKAMDGTVIKTVTSNEVTLP